MGALSDYLNDYAARHPGVREQWAESAAKFWADCPDLASTSPACAPFECQQEHPALAGPNMDIGQCPDCWSLIGVMRPDGESFGWHFDDCALPLRHAGYCEHGGIGHVIPPGWKLRG